MPVVIRCCSCQHEQRLNAGQTLDLLQQRGMLKRQAEPDEPLMRELLGTVAADLPCRECAQRGVSVHDDWVDDWADEVRCQGCRAVIPPERLEVFPDTEYCPSCQQKLDSGQSLGADEGEYCPRCAGPMKLVKGGGSGVSRYRMVCGDCGRTG